MKTRGLAGLMLFVQSYSQREKKRKKKKREKRNQLGLEIRCAAASFVQPLFCLDLQKEDRPGGTRARAKPNPF